MSLLSGDSKSFISGFTPFLTAFTSHFLCSEYQHFTELVHVDMLAVFGDNAERFVDLRLSSLSAHGEPTSFTIRTSGGGFEGV